MLFILSFILCVTDALKLEKYMAWCEIFLTTPYILVISPSLPLYYQDELSSVNMFLTPLRLLLRFPCSKHLYSSLSSLLPCCFPFIPFSSFCSSFLWLLKVWARNVFYLCFLLNKTSLLSTFKVNELNSLFLNSFLKDSPIEPCFNYLWLDTAKSKPSWKT